MTYEEKLDTVLSVLRDKGQPMSFKEIKDSINNTSDFDDGIIFGAINKLIEDKFIKQTNFTGDMIVIIIDLGKNFEGYKAQKDVANLSIKANKTTSNKIIPITGIIFTIITVVLAFLDYYRE